MRTHEIMYCTCYVCISTAAYNVLYRADNLKLLALVHLEPSLVVTNNPVYCLYLLVAIVLCDQMTRRLRPFYVSTI